MPTPSPRPTGRHPLVATTLVVVGLASGCITGQRPTLREPVVVDDPAAQTVLDRLGTVGTTEFSATYEVTPTSGGETATARVVQGGGRLRVTVGTVDYVVDADGVRTCGATGCVDELDDARISNLNITHRFWGDAFATRLARDAARRIGFSTATDDTIAGAPAACVDLTLPASGDRTGTVRYCALDAGPLARYVGADVVIEMVEFSPVIDPAELDAAPVGA